LTKTHITIVILILFSIFLGYLLLEKKQEDRVISIPQIQIVQKQEAVKEEPKTVQTETPDAILSQLKMAISQSKQNLELSEEEQARLILEALKRESNIKELTENKKEETSSITKQKNYISSLTEEKVLQALQSLKKEKTKEETKKQTIETKNNKQQNNKSTKLPTTIMVQKNKVTFPPLNKDIKPISSTKMKKENLPKKFILKKSSTQYTIVKKVTIPIQHNLNTSTIIKPIQKIVKKTIQKKKIVKKKSPIIKTHIVKERPTLQVNTNSVYTKKSKLSREEEVAQYKQASANGLVVVGVSNLFEIDSPQNTRPDADYFEPITSTIQQNNHEPIGFVKTLGVVEVSQKYEVGNLEIPQMVQLAKEGVVDISSASVETEALKKLKFIDPLEVVEVSEAFETIEANRYIK